MNAIHFLYRRAMTKIFLECRLSPSVFGLAAIWNSSLHNYYSPKAKFQPDNLEHAFRLFHRCLAVITWSVFKTSITVLNVSRTSALPWTLKIPEKKWNLPCIYHISLSQLRSGQWRRRVQQNYADGIEGLIAPLVPRSVHERNPLQLQSFWRIITFYPASSSWISNSSQVSKSQPSGQCRIWSEESRPFQAFPHPVAFWCQKDSSSAHCQVLAILQLEGERSSKVLRYRRALQRGWHHRVLQSERSRSALQSHGLDQAKAVGAPCSDLRPRHFTSGQGLHHYVRSLPASTSDLWPKLQSSREPVSGLDVTIYGWSPPAIRPRSRPPGL